MSRESCAGTAWFREERDGRQETEAASGEGSEHRGTAERALSNPALIGESGWTCDVEHSRETKHCVWWNYTHSVAVAGKL